MYLSILVLCVNLLVAFPQTWAQPLRHHLTSHRHHMGLHHHLSAPKLSSPEGLGQHILSSRFSYTPTQLDLDPRYHDDPNFQDLKLSHGLSDT